MVCDPDLIPYQRKGKLHVAIVGNRFGDRAALRRIELAIRNLKLRSVMTLKDSVRNYKFSLTFRTEGNVFEKR